jgi:hypothetical protein
MLSVVYRHLSQNPQDLRSLAQRFCANRRI